MLITSKNFLQISENPRNSWITSLEMCKTSFVACFKNKKPLQIGVNPQNLWITKLRDV